MSAVAQLGNQAKLRAVSGGSHVKNHPCLGWWLWAPPACLVSATVAGAQSVAGDDGRLEQALPLLRNAGANEPPTVHHRCSRSLHYLVSTINMSELAVGGLDAANLAPSSHKFSVNLLFI